MKTRNRKRSELPSHVTSTEGQLNKNLTLQEQLEETLTKAMTENGKTLQKERQSSKIEKVKNAKQELKNDKNQVINGKIHK